MGLLGFGAIAREVARKLTVFDVKVKAFDLYPNEAAAKALGVEMVSQDEIIETCDIVSLHVPATDANHHQYNKDCPDYRGIPGDRQGHRPEICPAGG